MSNSRSKREHSLIGLEGLGAVLLRQLDAARFVTHHFTFDEFLTAYEVFSNAAETGALKVVLSRAL